VKGVVNCRIGMEVASNMEDPTAARDDIIDVARPFGQAAQTVGSSACRKSLRPCAAAIRVRQHPGIIQ
jgi:hypothetical protein